MYLADTNVISETRREERANEGVRAFFRLAEDEQKVVHLSVVTVAELRRGVFRLRSKGDAKQAATIEAWTEGVFEEYAETILPVSVEIGRVWGRLRVPHAEPALDKLIAATALVHKLTVVTRNVKDFEVTGVKTLNPFEQAGPAHGTSGPASKNFKPAPPPSPSPHRHQYTNSPPHASAHAPSTPRSTSRESAPPTPRSDARARMRRHSH
jgi:toxin FitB